MGDGSALTSGAVLRARMAGAAFALASAVSAGGAGVVPPLLAQEAEAPVEEARVEGRGWLRTVLGESPGRDRVIGGLWAMHPFESQFPELDGTQGLGGLWGHWFGATFVNSYDERTFILGIERSWASVRRGILGLGIGYRVGLITGYDERLFELAGHTPVLPFGGLLIWTQVGRVGLDSYYVYRAITLEASLVF